MTRRGGSPEILPPRRGAAAARARDPPSAPHSRRCHCPRATAIGTAGQLQGASGRWAEWSALRGDGARTDRPDTAAGAGGRSTCRTCERALAAGAAQAARCESPMPSLRRRVSSWTVLFQSGGRLRVTGSVVRPAAAHAGHGASGAVSADLGCTLCSPRRPRAYSQFRCTTKVAAGRSLARMRWRRVACARTDAWPRADRVTPIQSCEFKLDDLLALQASSSMAQTVQFGSFLRLNVNSMILLFNRMTS